MKVRITNTITQNYHESYHQNYHKIYHDYYPRFSYFITGATEQEQIQRQQIVRAISTMISTEPTETAEASRRATTMATIYAMMHCFEYAAETGRSTTDCAAKEVTTVKWSATPTTMQCLMTYFDACGNNDALFAQLQINKHETNNDLMSLFVCNIAQNPLHPQLARSDVVSAH